MTPIALIEAAATLLWVYAGLTLAHWAYRTARLERRDHIPALADLISHLVPAMILLVLTVLAGALIGLPSVVAFIAILFPAGLAFGSHMALHEHDPPPTQKHTLARIAFTLALSAALITIRQVL
jgi:di/tricarboxylate transporter